MDKTGGVHIGELVATVWERTLESGPGGWEFGEGAVWEADYEEAVKLGEERTRDHHQRRWSV